MNLVRAEASRLFARRFVQVMLLLLLAAFGVTVATTIAGSHQPTAAEVSRAEAQAAEQFREAERWYSQCLAQQRGLGSPDPERFPANCEDLRPRQPDAVEFLYGVFVFEKQIRPLTYFLIAFLALFGFLVGASYVGAELTSGGMTNLLLWRPQRMVVLGTKLGTLLAATLLVSVVAGPLYLGTFWVIAEVRGLPGELDAEFWRWLGLTAGRGLVLVLLVTAIAFAIATVGRHTSAALGAMAAYVVVWEGGARIVMEIVKTARPDQWMLSTHLGVWMAGRGQFWDRSACTGDVVGYCGDEWYTLHWPTSLAVLLAVTAVCVGAAFLTFQRRDLA